MKKEKIIQKQLEKMGCKVITKEMEDLRMEVWVRNTWKEIAEKNEIDYNLVADIIEEWELQKEEDLTYN